MSTRAALAALLAVTLSAALAPPASAAATTPRASLTDIEGDVMCVSCHEPLALAQSPQAISERAMIAGLIDKGQTKAQIERALVANYGPTVLGRPPARGFDLTVYVLPPVIVALGLATLAVTLPKWRRRTRAAAASPQAAGAALDPADARRLTEDLARSDQ